MIQIERTRGFLTGQMNNTNTYNTNTENTNIRNTNTNKANTKEWYKSDTSWVNQGFSHRPNESSTKRFLPLLSLFLFFGNYISSFVQIFSFSE